MLLQCVHILMMSYEKCFICSLFVMEQVCIHMHALQRVGCLFLSLIPLRTEDLYYSVLLIARVFCVVLTGLENVFVMMSCH